MAVSYPFAPARAAVLALGVAVTSASCQVAPGSVPETAAGLERVAEIALPGRAVRFDYQAVDTAAGRLYMAHMNAGSLLVFDTQAREVVDDLAGFSSVHGVIAAPEVGKVYATATGDHETVVVDAASLDVLARLGPVGYGDGLAYAPGARRVFVSDESSAGMEQVVDAVGDSVVGRIALGGEAGNTIWDPVGRRILVAVQTRSEVVSIDPERAAIIDRYPVPGSHGPHGLVIDPVRRLLFVADEDAGQLFVLDLASMQVRSSHRVGGGPDVLAMDPGLGRLYVACESGEVDVFEVGEDGDLRNLGELRIPYAHTVAVDPATHLVYLPIQNVGGKPVLEIYRPVER